MSWVYLIYLTWYWLYPAGPLIPVVAYEFKRRYADKQEVVVSKQVTEVKLGESCVLVEKNDHSFKSDVGHVQKSYKVTQF